MNISKFNKEELTIIESFLQSATTINNIYNNIYNLEISSKKETSEYNNQLKLLKEAIEKENKIYHKSNLTIEQKFKIIELLTNSPNSINLNDINCIINQNENDIINRRIINILIKETIITKDITDSKIPQKINKLIEKLKINTNQEEITKNIFKNSKIELAIKNDITLVFLSIINETLNLFKYSNYQYELKKIIYNTSFINKDIEINSKLINDILKNNQKNYNNILNTIIKSQLKNQILALLEIKNKEYNNNKTNISSIINQCYIRALLTFLTEEDIYIINDKFHKLINSPNYLSKHPNNKISIENIINCLKNIKYDKTKKRIISLNRNSHN